MNRIAVYAVLILAAASMCLGQDASSTQSPAAATPQAASAAPATPDNAIRGAFPTMLAKSIDSKKLKEGDQIICQTVTPIRSNSGLMIPTGSKVIGHVTQATARSKGDPDSSLAFVFDKIELAKGKELPMKGVLQAVAPSLGNTGPDTGVAGSGSLGSSGSRGGSGSVGTTPPPTNDGVAGPNVGIHPLQGTTNHPLLNSQTVGVLGFHNLEMDKNNVLTSTGKEVKLDSGTQMMIRATIQPPVQ